MTSFRKAIRFCSLVLTLGVPFAASAATFDVKTLIDTDNNRGSGCNVVTPGGIVSGIDVMITTAGSVTGSTGTVTAVTRQTCVNPVLNQFSSPTAVDGGWNVGVSPIGDVFVESHMGLDVLTMDNIGTPRFVFTASSGLSSDVLLTPWSWGGGDIIMPHAGRDRAVTPTLPRNILLDGLSSDWAGNVPLANGTAAPPVWRFISAGAYAGLHDLFFNFQIHTNPAAPTAHDDNYAVSTLGGTLTVATLGVLNNDNPNNQPITASLVDTTQHGTLALAPNGGFVYIHDGSLASQDQFHYVAVGTTLSSNVATVTIDLPGTHPYTFTSANNVTFIDGQPNTFLVTVTGKPTPELSVTGDLPAGVTFHDNGDGTGVLSGTPAANTSGDYALVFHADKNKPHNSSQNFTLTVTCPGVFVVNPAVTTGTAGTPFSQTFTQNGGTPPVTFTLNSGTLPPGLALSTGGVLSGTPTGSGTFPITVKVTDVGGCTAVGPTYNLVIACHPVTVNNPATSTGTATTAFSQTFTQSGAVGGATFALNSGTLPAGLSLSGAGVLSGTPTQTGSFPITVRVTDGQGCVGVSPTYNLTIGCQTITVTNPATNTGVAAAAFSQTFTAGNTIGAVTFSTASTLPTGLTLSSAGVLSGTPTQTGSFPIVVKATDANGCFGNGATYNLTIACQTITVNNPATNTGTVNTAFSQSFTAPAAIGTAAFTINSGTLPTGLTLSSAGVLSGTPTQTGSFPITVKATDANGCFGISATYTLTIGCQTITVNNPATNSGTVNVAFSQNFTTTNSIGAVTFTLNSGTLPTGITLSSAGVLSGTPTQIGSFPITVHAVDANGCSANGPTYTLTIGCQTITVTNPATTSGVAGTAFSQTFTQTNASGGATFSLNSGTLPAGLTLSAAGVLSGTPTQTGPFPITVKVTDGNGCTGIGATYNLVINCQTITVTNPATTTGTAGTAFSQTFTQTGGIGTTTFAIFSGTLPTGMTFHSSTGVLDGTPTQTGSFPLIIRATDSNSCSGDGATYTLVIGCQTITVTNPATTTGTAGTPFSQSFSQSGSIGGSTFSLNSGSLPAGLTLSAAGLLSGTPTQTGSFPITVKVTDGNNCTGIGATYTLVIGCQTINVTNPATTTGTIQVAFNQTFTQSGAIGGATFSLNSGSLPAGLTLSSAGVLSGTPTVIGSFPITVKVTDGNGCTGVGATYNLVINCQTITVTNPVNTTGTVSAGFSETFTQTGANGTATFTTASTLPTGLTLSSAGVLSGTPTQSGPFSIVVTVTDSNGCTGTSATYNLVINCQTITVGNPATTSSPAGVPLSINFTQTGAIGTATFTTSSTLPTGLTLAANGTLSGTPSGSGAFPIVVTVTDSNGCTGTNPSYTLTITCPTITVTNPGVSSGTSGVAFSQTFTQTGGQGTITWSKTGTLPAGITLNSATGVLSGTTNAAGSFPITVTATDSNGCSGTGATYTLTINCQTITVTNPGVNTGTVDAPFSQTFTKTGILGTVTWSETGALPAGITLNSATGVLSGTPTVTGSFSITVTATDTNGCSGSSPYTLTINCQTITVTNPGVNTGTVDAPFSQTFTQTGAHGTATFTTASTLPAGLSLSTAGVLSGTPTVKGPFSITVTVTDSNSCTGTNSPIYTLTINCQTITVTNPATTTGTAGTAFSQNFTQSGAHGTATFSTASTLPSGFSLSAAGVLSGVTTQHGTFPIVVTVTDSNSCTGTSATYNLTIACNAITVTNPATTTGTVASPFSQTFTSSGILGTASYTTASTLPTGLTLHSATGILDGTPTQSGSFPIVVTATDSNGCTGTGATYTLVISCNVLTVTPPGVTSGTAGTPFSQTFTQTGGNGTITWSETGALPAGITINTSTGALFGTTSQTGSFPITVTATDANGCSGSTPYTLTINCQTITVTNPGVSSVQAGVAFDQAFTATGILGTATWSETGTLPTGITLNTATGHLTGTTTQLGSFSITVTATDTNGCSGTGAIYTLTVTCPPITVARNGGGSFPAGIFNTAYTGQSVTATPASTYTFAVTSGSLPTGLSLSGAGAISGTPTATGVFTFTVTATDSASLCTGSQSFSISIAPAALNDSYPAASHIIDNVQFVITGGATASPATPFVGAVGNILTNDLPSGGVTATPGTFSTTGGGSVTIAADGTFIYTPAVHAAAIASDTFTYTAVSNGVTSAPATVTLTLANRVWFVKNDGGAGDGRSHLPFNTLVAAQTASAAGDIIYVYNGNNTTSGHTAGITLKANQQLIGEGVALVVNTVTLKAAGASPKITNTAAVSDAITLANGGNNTVKGVTVTGATRDGITGINSGTFTGDTLIVQNNVTNGIVLNNSAAVTITNSTISGNGIGLQIIGGGAAVDVDNTNTITANAGQRSVAISARISTGTITIGAAITDNGTGISVSSPVSGTPIVTFTGTQTLNTTTNQAVTLTSNTNSTINFSGTLNITTTTGTGFGATGGGTLNVSGTANITTGAAANGLNLNGMTVGGTGVDFDTVTTTGATTAIALTNVTGLVTVNGGTITNGTTGISLQGLSTSLTLANITITGPTTGITNTTNFGTLTIGASVNVSGVTALNLTTGALNGTFANLSSTGGTNGVVLTSISGTGWAATTGSLAGATGAGFKVDGGSASMTYGGSITSTGFLVDIGATTGRSGGTITFSTGTLGGAGVLAGTGIRIQNSTGGTFTFSGTQTLGTSGSRMASTAVTLTTNSGATINFSGTMSIFTGAVTAFSATGGGTINFSGTDSIDSSASALSLTGVALGAGTLSNLTAAGGVNGVALTTVTGGTLTISAGSISGATGAAFLVSGGSVSVTDNGTVSQATAAQPLVSVAAGHTGTLTFGANVTATNGLGLQFDNADGTYNFNGTTNSLNGGDAGVDIINGSGGTFSFSSGTSINNPTGVAYNEDTSTANVTYAGTITKNNNAANAVNINAKSGGTTTFSGAITGSTSTGNAIDLTNSGGTVNFSGALTLTTTSGVAFNATTGGTVNVTNAGNTITVSASGTGINWNGVTGGSTETFSTITGSGSGIGMAITNSGGTDFTVGTVSTATGTAVSLTTVTGDFIFTKISTNGANKGVSFNNAAAGGTFTVNGTGGLCDAGHVTGTDCTGGTIQGGSSRGVEFVNAGKVTLKNMLFLNTAQTSAGAGTCKTAFAVGTTGCSAAIYFNGVTDGNGGTTDVFLDRIFINGTHQMGIAGTGVNGMTLTNTEVENTTLAANEAAVTLINNTGTVGITALNLHNNDNGGTGMLFVENGVGTMTLNVTSSTFNKGTVNSGGINAASYNSANMTVNIQTSTFGDVAAGNGLFSNGVTAAGNDNSTFNCTINGSSFVNTNGISAGSGGSGAATVTYNITNNNPIQNKTNGSNGITFGKGSGSSAVTSTVTGNVITKADCGNCAGMRFNGFGAGGSSNATITGNTISTVNEGILVAIGQGSTTNNVVIQSNTISGPVGTLSGFAIDATNGTQAGDNPCTVLNIGGAGALANTISGVWFSQANGAPTAAGWSMNFDNEKGALKMPSYVSPTPTYMSARNPSVSSAQILDQSVIPIVSGTTCP
ncbi:MAG TPA: putative Ig domain-containing protein [Thermoanaerobaculia bacterium]|jgi:hypothetical protein|nr:putative Ig domain-containing protein [Thermoanaerobaculia bacterium]